MNREEVARLIHKFRKLYPNKTAWLYTGYLWEDVKDLDGISELDVLCDGEFMLDLKDEKVHWVGSTNQRVIDVKKTLETGEIVLHKS